jgi:hypothetical protein
MLRQCTRKLTHFKLRGKASEADDESEAGALSNDTDGKSAHASVVVAAAVAAGVARYTLDHLSGVALSTAPRPHEC